MLPGKTRYFSSSLGRQYIRGHAQIRQPGTATHLGQRQLSSPRVSPLSPRDHPAGRVIGYP